MVNTASLAAPLPSYKHPPVIEVSFGAIFQRLDGFQTRHFGQFWAEQRADYPVTSDISPLVDVTDLEAQRLVIMNLPPLRRMMCFSENQQFVAQIQDSRLHLNWRKVQPQDEYPRYDVVHIRFERLWSDFSKFVERERVGNISLLRFELSYFNHIELGTNVANSLEEHIRFFRFSPVQPGYLSPPESVNAVWRFAMPDQKGTATASLTNATDKDGRNLLVLVFTCTGTPSEKYTATEWYDSAHEWIVRSFTDLTTAKAHQKWGREK